MRMKTDDLLKAFHKQLESWNEAADNYKKLSKVKKKEIPFGDVPLSLQYNPARAVSTGAKIDAKAIKERPCFLCEHNRPQTQIILESFGDWEVLLNPFPIFKHHFTIVNKVHQDQDNINFADMAEFTLSHPGILTFYNGSHSGASCPDHLHFQATLAEELPIASFLNSNKGKLIMMRDGARFYYIDSLPAPAVHIISSEYSSLITNWCNRLLKTDDEGKPDKSLRNILMWSDEESKLHTLIIPRASHRPLCYTGDSEDTDQDKFMVSPGAVDMACLVITPREKDFEALGAYDVARILAEVGFDFTSTEALRNLLIQ